MDLPITAKAALLQALVAGPSFGLDLIERVHKGTFGEVTLAQGAAYPALRALERDALIEACEGPQRGPDAGGRPRAYWRATAAGLKVAGRQRQAMAAVVAMGAGPVGRQRAGRGR